MIPKRLHRYFWEINPKELRPDQDADYIVSRLLDYGKTQDIEWLIDVFGREEIKKVLEKYRGISRKTTLFWTNILGLDPVKVKCLQTPYRPIPYKDKSWRNARDANRSA